MSPTPLSGWRWPYIHYWKYMRLLSAVHQGHRGSPSPTCCKNHVPRPPLPLVSPRSGNRVNPLEGPQSVSGSGEAHTKERNTPISPHHQHHSPPPPFVVLSCFRGLPSFHPSPQVQGYDNHMHWTSEPQIHFPANGSKVIHGEQKRHYSSAAELLCELKM